ncbi:cell division protein ZapA [Halothermothrix orenii]|uniref:Cell division protein ZapA n=1 Tax=Halothermothrix orenii (strain H 168 / OCM 544 / DSM 9562) TaxID=373903 RepID=B8D295_HALOH|nr:cell division protein ZapA [Halothermothrix orenii]ACL69322.1 hypothetical protein Hore_05650 [Halothermothrix orenii H 168]
MPTGDKSSKGKAKKYKVNVLGEEMTVVADVTEEYIDKLIEYINDIGEAITRAYPGLPRRRITGLTLINMADEYYKLKKVYRDRIKEINNLREENKKLQNKINEMEIEQKELISLLEEVDQ